MNFSIVQIEQNRCFQDTRLNFTDRKLILQFYVISEDSSFCVANIRQLTVCCHHGPALSGLGNKFLSVLPQHTVRQSIR